MEMTLKQHQIFNQKINVKSKRNQSIVKVEPISI